MFLIGLRRSGSVCLLLFTLTLFANFASTAPMSFRWLLQKVLPPGVFLRISPFLQKGRMPLEGLGMQLVLPEGFPLLPLDLVQREGWRSLWSRVRCARARFCLLGSFVDWGYGSCSLAAKSCYFLCPMGSLSSSLYVRRGDGVGESFRTFLGYVLGCLSRLISARSARWWGGWDFRVPLLLEFLPGLPIFGLRGREVTWARSWSSGFRLRSCCSLCRSACRARLSSRDAVRVDRLVSYFPLCGRYVSVGGLRTANAFPVFALVVSVGPVVVFWPLATPPTPLWHDR